MKVLNISYIVVVVALSLNRRYCLYGGKDGRKLFSPTSTEFRVEISRGRRRRIVLAMLQTTEPCESWLFSTALAVLLGSVHSLIYIYSSMYVLCTMYHPVLNQTKYVKK